MSKVVSLTVTFLMIGALFSSGIGFDTFRQRDSSNFSGTNSTVNLSNWLMNPASGPIDGGTEVTISGSGFSSLLEPTAEIVRSWTNTTVDSSGSVGKYTSLAVDPSGDVHISYYDESSRVLKYTTYNGSSWTNTTVDSSGDVGWYTAIAVDPSGNVHISYDDTYSHLKYATYNGSSWTTSTVDSSGDVGFFTSLDVDSNGDVHISYFDGGNNDLKYATYNGSSWTTSTVDSVGDVGWYTSLDVDSNGDVHISYYDERIGPGDGDLMYATYDGDSWTTSTVDSVGVVGWFTSLAVDSNRNVHISYYDDTNANLKYATLSGGNSSLSANEFTVQFGDYGNVTGTVVDDSTITVTSPQGPPSGEVVDITLWDWNDTGYVLNSAFTYLDPDLDGDGVQNALDDCPEVAGNSTNDQIGCPDSDGDGYSDSGDSFPSDPGEWSDGDGDGVGDNGDAFPEDRNESLDSDGDGIGDNEDEYPLFANHTDSDGDGFLDFQEDFPTDSTQWSDYDSDGIGDNWGNSSWNATRLLGWPGQFVEGAELADHCPTQFGNSSANGFYGCPDDDGDGIANLYDNSTDDENETAPVDTDGDGVWDSEDLCPDTIENGTVDATGCLLDSDGDGIDDLQDKCANTKNGAITNADGCEIVEEPKEESESYVNSLLAGDSETIRKTVGYGAILIAVLAFLQTNFIASMLPESFRWLQVLRKKSKLSAEEEQELGYLQSLVQAYHYEPETLIEELHQLKSDLTARYTNNELKKTTREKMNTLIADLLMMDKSELERVANNEAYFGLAGTIDTNQRSELLSQELAMRSDTPDSESGIQAANDGDGQ